MFQIILIMPIKRLTLFQRAKSLVFIKRGNSVEQTIQLLQKRYHPSETLEEIRKKYFPKRGTFAIATLKGAKRQQIVNRLHMMKLSEQGTSERMRKLNQDPEFAKALKERSS